MQENVAGMKKKHYLCLAFASSEAAHLKGLALRV